MEIGPGLSATAREISSTVCGVTTLRMLTGYSAVTSVTATVESECAGRRTSGASYNPIALTAAEKISSAATKMSATRSARRARGQRLGFASERAVVVRFVFLSRLERNHDIG